MTTSYRKHLKGLKKTYKDAKNKQVVQALKQALKLMKDYTDKHYPDGVIKP